MLQRLRRHFDRNELVHTPLVNARSIRLLTIMPARRFRDPIKCRLDTACLHDEPIYEALSYVWGTPERIKWVKCNDKRMHITQNLDDALLHLRYEAEERVVWIDQLCINQLDLDERSQQVSLMGEIYWQAKRVIVWLGLADEETQLVWNLMDKIQDIEGWTGKEPKDLPSAYDIYYKPDPTPSEELSNVENEYWWALERFLLRTWFWRMWAFQELVVSQDCLLQCGTFHVPWSVFSRVCSGIVSAGQDSRIKYRTTNIIYLISAQASWKAQGRSMLSRLLEDTRGLKASEPRDKIYALQALSPIKVDIQYHQSLHEVYTCVVEACIKHEKSLAILSEVEIRDGNAADLPTWVADWRSRESYDWRISGEHFRASNDLAPVLLKAGKFGEIVLRGFSVAKVARILDVIPALGLDGFSDDSLMNLQANAQRWQPRTWRRSYWRAIEGFQVPEYCSKGSEHIGRFEKSLSAQGDRDATPQTLVKEASFRRTISAGYHPASASPHLDKISLEVTPQYALWEQAGFPDDIPPAVLYEHDVLVADTMRNRRFFIVGEEEDAYMGIASRTIKEGDVVCILLGGSVPYVLRPNGDKWEFISDCYADGIMFGEAMERTKEDGFQYEDFTLI